MRDYVIVTDSASDLPKEILKEYDIPCLPLYYSIDGVIYGDEKLCQLAAFCGTLALGAVHVQRQADDDELGFDFFCHLADPGGNFVPGLDGDLRRDGGSQELGAVAGGEAGAPTCF